MTTNLESYFTTFDTVGYFKNLKISCVIVMKNIIPQTVDSEVILNDVKREL